MVRKIMENVPEDLIHQDLEKYRKEALTLGVTDAKTITADMVIIDERVRAKCVYPVCARYGSNIHCPPHGADLELVRRLIDNFHYGIFTKLEVPTTELSGPGAIEKKLPLQSGLKNYEIISKIENAAFCDGHYFSMGFANGSCKATFCHSVECSALMPGQGCRHPYWSRPSMESMGMNAYMMATKAGWDVYPLGRSTCPEDVPKGVVLGLVLIC